MTPMRTISIPLIGLAAAVAVSACGASNSAGPTGSMGSRSTGPATASATHNAADVTFATDMIPHHGQAIVMANQVLTKTRDPKVRQLAESIKQAQTPEITEMSNWLRAWKQPVPAATSMAMSMNGMNAIAMSNMMSASQMNQMANATSANAATVFLTLMPMHHQGAITMARTELASGRNPQTKVLAQSIITTQTAEITKIHRLLAALAAH